MKISIHQGPNDPTQETGIVHLFQKIDANTGILEVVDLTLQDQPSYPTGLRFKSRIRF
jgi:hypothetical protein